MEYLIHPRKPSRKAHIWDGLDTLCHAYENKVISKNSNFIVANDPGGRDVCRNCSDVARAWKR